MPLSYQQNKKHIQKWVENNPEKEREKVLRGMKHYYDKNREMVNMKNLARYRLGTSFYSFCNIYTNLYE
jgi:hypothetical protein